MSSAQVPGPVVSPDGRWIWDGRAWRSAPPHLSEDGEWSWTGRGWEASARRQRVSLLMWLAAAAAAAALFMVNGVVIYAADVPAADRVDDVTGLWIMVLLVNAPAVVLGSTVAALARRRREARLVGVLAALAGVAAAAFSIVVLAVA